MIFCLVMFVYAVMAMHLFGYLELEDAEWKIYGEHNVHTSFRAFSYSSMTLMQIGFRARWVRLMREIMNKGGAYENAFFYFIMFQLTVTNIFTNIMIAIIVHQYAFTVRTSDSVRRKQDRVL